MPLAECKWVFTIRWYFRNWIDCHYPRHRNWAISLVGVVVALEMDRSLVPSEWTMDRKESDRDLPVEDCTWWWQENDRVRHGLTSSFE